MAKPIKQPAASDLSASAGSHSLAAQVKAVQDDRDKAINLAAKILGTIRENTKAGNLKTTSDTGDALLRQWIAKWDQELDGIRSENREKTHCER